jgi:uncharacterized protein (DUF58 family)
VLVYLNAGSIYFGSHQSKQDTMAQIMTSLGISATSQNDLLTSIYFSTKEDKYFKGTKDKRMVDLNINTIYDLPVLGNEIDYTALNQYLLNKVKRKSLIFLIGDFLESVDFNTLGQKHEVYCAIVRDRFEEDLHLAGQFNIIDTNNQEIQDMYLDDTSIKKYNEMMKSHDKNLCAGLRKSGIRYIKIYTDQNVVPALKKLLKA